MHLIQLAVTQFVSDEVSADGDDGEWSSDLDARRCELIDREIADTISVTERAELGLLQQRAERHLDEVAAPPIDHAVELHQRILTKSDA